jgi:hypothetical protein
MRHAVAALAALLALAPAAAEARTTTVTAPDGARGCTADRLADAEGARTAFTAPRLSYLSARLTAASGDWDLGVFDARSGRRVAAAAGVGATELAQGYVKGGQRLVAVACRLDSGAARATLTTSFGELHRSSEKLQLVRVKVTGNADVHEMEERGLDVTEHGTGDAMDVLLHGRADLRTLLDLRLPYTVLDPDVAATDRAARRADARYAATTDDSGLPSGRTEYRQLADYESDMKALAAQHPSLVRLFELPHKTLEGRTVLGVEIAQDVRRTDDGRPVFAQFGVHHAREWPSSEHAMEWAFELVKGTVRGDARTSRLTRDVRTVVVPVVNPDGFNLSVSKAPVGTSTSTHEMKRKNCRAQTPEAQESSTCASRPASHGVDPNRNYGGLWGGVGASTSFTSETFRGAEHFSEPETQNVRWLVSTRHVTGLITNHTHGGLVLRPPGVAAQGWAPDEAAMKDLGDRMASHNGYTSQYSWQLYDTNGTTEDWTYNATGGYGYTFEIGTGGNFHLAYQTHVVGEYLGTGSVRGAGKGGNREAYFQIMEDVAHTDHHGVITGEAPNGLVLELTKAFKTSTAAVLNGSGVPGEVIRFDDRIDTTLEPSGAFAWHVNPSTRPEVRGGRLPNGKPQTPGFALTPGSVPTLPVNQQGLNRQDFPFTVTEDQDNGYMRARIDWTQTNTNYDLELYRRNADGSLTQLGKSVNSAAARPFEELQSVHMGPGQYVLRVVNVQAVSVVAPFSGKVEFFPPEPPEAYTLTCRTPAGQAIASQDVVVGRGQRVDVGEACRP